MSCNPLVVLPILLFTLGCGHAPRAEDPTPPIEACTIADAEGHCLTVVQLSAASVQTCVLLSDRTVRCWGKQVDSFGEANRPIPIDGLENVLRIDTGDEHACAVLETGECTASA